MLRVGEQQRLLELSGEGMVEERGLKPGPRASVWALAT